MSGRSTVLCTGVLYGSMWTQTPSWAYYSVALGKLLMHWNLTLLICQEEILIVLAPQGWGGWKEAMGMKHLAVLGSECLSTC